MCTDCGCGPAVHQHHHSPGAQSQGRIVRVEEDLLAKNNRLAAENRRLFREKGLLVYNLVSSPGSGKTTLLERTLTDLQHEMLFAVLEGDQQTSNDADRVAATVNPRVRIFELSCQSGSGLTPWYDWLRQEVAAKRRSALDDMRGR